MDRVYEELEEARAEIEKLKAEYRIKAELSENLKKTHNEQLIKIQESSFKIEKQAQELNDKAEEISVTKQMYEDLKCRFNEKESIIKRLSSANEKLRVDSDEMSRRWEEKNRELALALDEANEKSRDQERKIHAFQEEIEGLKQLLSVSQRKCLEAERKAKAPNELRQRDDMLLKLEEENMKVEDQLKWKKEQFKHLEEAHEKLRDQFQTSKKEWELEISTLLDKICSLQTRLDSQIRISEDLQSRLQRCNQALAHEESQRKYLEVQLSESKSCFENTFSECQEAKAKIECLTLQREKEIAALRNSLGTKETLFKEMEYQSGKLELENQELRLSLKELQEAMIHEAGTTASMAKLRNKLRSLEQVHRGCSANLRIKEAEWSSQLETMAGDLNNCRSELKSKDTALKELKMELEGSEQMHRDCSANLRAKEIEWSSQLDKMTEDLNNCRSELESKDTAIKELKMELEGCHTSIMQLNEEISLIMQLKLQNEEISLMLPGSMEAQSKLDNEKAEMDLHNKEKEENVSLLMEELEMKNTALVKAQADIDKEREKAALLLRRVESFDLIEQQHLLLQKEREEKVSLLLEELEMKNTSLVKAQADIDEEREKAASLLRRVESLDLIEQQQLLLQKEIERHEEMLMESSGCQLRLKEQALQMEVDFKEKLREVSDALDRANSELADKTCEGSEIEFELQVWKSIAERLKADLGENHEMRREIEASLLAQVVVEETLKREKDGLVLVVEEKERTIDNLQQQILLLDRELKTREETASFATTETAMAFESEKHSFLQIAKEKDRILEDLQKEIVWLEQESMRRELEGAMLAQISAERTFENEKENLIQLVHKKEQRIDNILQLLNSLEQKFNSSLISFSSQFEEKQAEINLVHEAWEKITTAEILAQLEIEEKKLMIVELEADICSIQQKLEYQEKSLSQSKQEAQDIEAELEAKQREMKKLTCEMETKLTTSDALINELKGEKRNLLEDIMKFSSEREDLLGFMGGLFDRIGEFSTEDMQLMGILGRIMQTFDNNELGLDLKGNDEFDSMKENVNAQLSPAMRKFEAIPDERSPFRVLNN